MVARSASSVPDSPDAALELLLEGNRRHRQGERSLRDLSGVGERIAREQRPFAAILGCADSRVSPTLIFDLAPGNIFVTRVAGNVSGPATLASVEFAVAVLGVKLVMVLGHSDCGAVRAALGVAEGTAGFPASEYGALGDLVAAIVPEVESVPAPERTLTACIEANVRAQAAEIAASDPVVRPAVAAGSLRVVPAVYEIDGGRVRPLDEAGAEAAQPAS